MYKDKFKNLKNRNILSLLLSILIFILIFIISISQIFYFFNKKIQDLYFMFNNISINQDIVVVEIDEETLSWRRWKDWNITREWLGRFPFDRKNYSVVIDNLNKAWVSIIALDIIFWEKSSYESDILLSNSIKNAWNVILWLWTDSSWILQYPYEKFANNMYYSWYLAPNISTTNKIVYSFKPFFRFRWNNMLSDHFILAIIKWFYSKIYNDESILKQKPILYKDKLLLSNNIELTLSSKYNNEELFVANKLLNWELSKKEEYEYNDVIKSIRNKENILINYTKNNFVKLSFLDVYYNNFDKNLLKNKIIIIWATANWIKDTFDTPIWNKYWVYVHVNAINTILTKNYIKYLNNNLELLLIFLFILICVYFNFNISRSSYLLIFSNLALVLLFCLFIIYSIKYTNYLLNYPVELGFSFILSLVISNILKYYIENKQKIKLNKALSEYVSVDVANEILSWDWEIKLDWEKKDIAIFFSDIEWFTSISEKLSPEELVSFLREYLWSMSKIIINDKWYVDKYEWDAIMALWWVKTDLLSTNRICISALLQQKKLLELNNIWKDKWLPIIKARIGLHYWSAVIWDIWSDWLKKNFTALWDNINLASRLEWVNKFYGTYICASEIIYEKEKYNFEFRYLDKIRVKWKKIPIKIYELLWFKWEISYEIIQIREMYNEWVKLYNNRDFNWAQKIFEKLIKMWDNASKFYLNMCNIYKETPPSLDWDWVSEMIDK